MLDLTVSGIFGGSFRIRPEMTCGCSSYSEENGDCPVSNSDIKTPTPHQSTLRSCPQFCSTISVKYKNLELLNY